MNILKTRIKTKTDSKKNWEANNPVLMLGELGIISDEMEIRIGNGLDKFSELSGIHPVGIATSSIKGICRPDNRTIEVHDGILNAISISLTPPTIDGDELVLIGEEYRYKLSSTSSIEGGKILLFEYTVLGETRTVEALDDTAEITIRIGTEQQDGNHIELHAVAVDNYGHLSKRTTKVLTVTKAKVLKPVILSPENGFVFDGKEITVITDEFRYIGAEDTYVSSVYRLTRDSSGNDVIYITNEVAVEGEQYTLTPDVPLESGVMYYLWVRKKGSVLGDSEWSDPIALKTPYIEKPVISSTEDRADLYCKAFRVSASPFQSHGITDEHTATEWRISRDRGTQDVILDESVGAVTDYTFTAGLEQGTEYFVSVRYRGSVIDFSEWSEPVGFTLLGEVIGRPVLESPKSDAEVYFGIGITGVADDFVVEVGDDVHLYSNWKLTSDPEGNVVISEAQNSLDLYVHAFSKESLMTDTTYYVFVQFVGGSGAVSEWSDGVSVRTVSFLLTEGKRRLYRHSSDMGSVLEFNDGKDRKVVILDAAYRKGGMTFGTYRVESPLANYTSLNINNNMDIDGDNDYDANINHPVIEDSELNRLWVGMIDTNTSRQNCDVWMTYSGVSDGSVDGVPMVEYCRGILVDNVPCDLPNIQICMRILCEANNIDLLDPTVDEHKELALGDTNPSGFFYGKSITSSTEAANIGICGVYANGSVRSIGKLYAFMTAVPVLELGE